MKRSCKNRRNLIVLSDDYLTIFRKVSISNKYIDDSTIDYLHDIHGNLWWWIKSKKIRLNHFFQKFDPVGIIVFQSLEETSALLKNIQALNAQPIPLILLSLGKNQEETVFLAKEFHLVCYHGLLSSISSKVILKVVDPPLVQKNLLLNFISAYLRRPTEKKITWMQRLLFWKFKQEKNEKKKEMSWALVISIKRSLYSLKA